MKQQFWQISILMFVVFFGFVGVSMPYALFAPLFLHHGHTSLISVTLTARQAALLLGITLSMYPLGQFVGTPVLGALSDQYGRKPLLLITMLGTAVGYVIAGLAIGYGAVSVLLFSRFMTGFFEGNLAIAQACISDMRLDKTRGLGALSAMAALGYVFGPMFGGLLADTSIVPWFDYPIPFYVAGVVAIIAALAIVYGMQETQTNKQLFDVKQIIEQFNFVARIRRLFKRKAIFYWVLVILGTSLATDTFYEFSPVLMVQRWQMDASSLAIFNMLLSVTLAVGSYVLPVMLTRRINYKYSVFGLLLVIIGLYVGFIFVKQIYPLYIYFLLFGVVFGTVNTLQMVKLSDSISPTEQGEILGLCWGMRMLGDGMICLIGSVLVLLAVELPLWMAVASLVGAACLCAVIKVRLD